MDRVHGFEARQREFFFVVSLVCFVKRERVSCLAHLEATRRQSEGMPNPRRDDDQSHYGVESG